MKYFVSGLIAVLCLALLLTACGAAKTEPAATGEPAASTEAAAGDETAAATAEPAAEDGPLTTGVAVTIGGRAYSPAEITYIYNSQFSRIAGSYAGSIMGLDASWGPVGLGARPYTGPETEGKSFATWRDYFLDSAYTYLGQVQHLIAYARENGIELTEEDLAETEDNLAMLDSYAAMYGFETVEEFVKASFGEGITLDILRTMEQENMLAGKAYTAYQESLTFGEEELAEAGAGYSDDYDSFSFAVYTVTPAAGEDGEIPDEARAEAEAEADAIIASYLDGDDVEDLYERFNGYLEEMLGESAGRSDAVLGRYIRGVYSDWLKDRARQPGDITKLQDGDSYSVALFLGRESGDYPTANIRHILIMAEQSEDGGWTEEALAAAKAEAERILAEWEAGEKTEESFAALAQQYSEDPGSASNGGLYENVYKGQMVPEFDAFCFAGHEPGDTGIVYGSNGGYAGYHVMYYAGEGPSIIRQMAEQALTEEALTEWLAELPAIVPGPDEALVDPIAES
ncbi:MAG: peptidylprolyl isomerase [Oscillospiraceae bacterium]|nr:peptidylprolyl isomerase [Oscillospiraceae bacterium]